MTDTAQDHNADVIDPLTLWRYWFIHARRGFKRDLLPVQRKDKTVWGRGITHAVCRRNPAHTPPHPDCTCGIYAIGPADIHFASAAHYWAGDQYERAANLGTHGILGVERPGHIHPQVPWLQAQAAAYRDYDIVIGRVQLYNAMLHQRSHDKLKCWRGSAALLEALYVSDRVTRHPKQLCAQLSEKYGVTCEIGYPPYTQDDWDNRTPTQLLEPRVDVTWADLGLYPPGTTAPPSKYFTATVPPRPERRRLRTWIEHT